MSTRLIILAPNNEFLPGCSKSSTVHWLGSRAATANCEAGRGGKVSPSLDTIVCPGADTHRLASHWSAAGNTGLWLADQGCIRPGSMTPGQRWGWWHLRTPSSWFLKIMVWFRQHRLSTPLENKCLNHGQVKWFPRELFNSDYSPLNVASMQI